MSANTKYWLCLPIWHTPLEMRVRVPTLLARTYVHKRNSEEMARKLSEEHGEEFTCVAGWRESFKRALVERRAWSS